MVLTRKRAKESAFLIEMENQSIKNFEEEVEDLIAFCQSSKNKMRLMASNKVLLEAMKRDSDNDFIYTEILLGENKRNICALLLGSQVNDKVTELMGALAGMADGKVLVHTCNRFCPTSCPAFLNANRRR